MTRNRDIAKFLGKTETSNTTNARLLTSAETVGLDSAQVTSIAEGQGLAAYTSIDSLPTTGLTAGDQAFVESSQRLYISTGTGWYNVALLNATPTLTLDQSGTIQLNADTLTVTVTASATDSDDNPDIITFSVESDGNMVGTGVTVSQDSSVFTITSLSQDSGGTAGDFTLTFKATDQINVDNESLDFTLSFSNVVDSSSATTLLMKAAGNSATNAAITYQNSSDVSTGFTEAGTPQASTLTPYRSGGYSTYFPGSADYLSFADNDALEFGSGDFTVEAWVYPEAIDGSFSVIVNRWDSTSLKSYIVALTSSAVYFYYSTTGSNQTLLQWSETVPLDEWTHLAIVRNGNDLNLYVNGTAHATTNSMSGVTLYGGTSVTKVGILGDLNSTTDFTGYIRDLRLIKGTAQYTSNFTAPTEALTAITNTVLLACHAPYLVDGSSTGHTLTINGTPKTMPFGPYDYEPWTADNHGGSVYFDGTGDYLTTAASTDYDLSGDVTVECWVRLDASASGNQTFWSLSQGNSDGYTIGYLRANVTPDQMAISTVGVAGLYAQGNMDHKEVWYHMAWVKQGTPSGDDEETRMYFNGKRILNSNGTALWNAPTTPTLTIGTNYQNTPSPTYGYIADFHWTNSAKYTGSSYTVPTSPVSADGNTIVRMNNKSDANIYDAAAANKLILAGDTQSATAQRKFTTSSSVSFDGTGDYAYQENSELFALGTGDFTVEAWIYYTTFSGSGGQAIVSTGTSTSSASAGHWYLTAYGASDLRFGRHGSAQYTSGASSLSTSAWHHLAVAREGTTVRIFVDGTALTTSDTAGGVGSYDFNNSSGYLFVGEGASFSPANGYMQDLRITKGKARYTSNFTPPTAEFEL